MGDVICRWCGEPWEYYHLKHEMVEGEKVLEGEGCPSCSWSEDIPWTEESTDSPEYEFAWKESIINGTDENVMDYI